MQYGDIWVYKSNYKKDYYTCFGVHEDSYDLIETFAGEIYNYDKETFVLLADWLIIVQSVLRKPQFVMLVFLLERVNRVLFRFSDFLILLTVRLI
jgi:hypothetical protein